MTSESMAQEKKALVEQAEALVKEHMAKPQATWLIICMVAELAVDRVRRTALKLAIAFKSDSHADSQEFPMPDMLLVELVALFHDMADAKYAETSSLESTLSPFLASELATRLLTPEQICLLLTIIPRISWSTEKKLRAAGKWNTMIDEMRKDGGWTELAVVQDADRLDAIGAFGIMRCCAYSSATNRPLYIPAEEVISAQKTDAHKALVDSSAIQHFHDKLLHIRDRMKTPLGKQEAQRRHETMQYFLQEIDHEFAA
ncbi:hypothetical protein QFC19_005009 [Naganishia cerealis]|uniref:Uncharacterized protein n=1 Tax=Naganishia cerealis TaxID=610337 RepID=A0ACC2VS53_9TREE|nr:hypothetical protein QFC19_005009 [Naganishia cerealis]